MPKRVIARSKATKQSRFACAVFPVRLEEASFDVQLHIGIHTPDGGYGFRAWRFAPSRNDETAGLLRSRSQ
jgi:hypothetical protein